VLDENTREFQSVKTDGVDVTHAVWRSDCRLLVAGYRGFESVVGFWDARTKVFRETWASADVTAGPRYFTVAGLNESADCVLVGESVLRAPAIATIRDGVYQPLRSLGQEYDEWAPKMMSVHQVRWSAPDDLEMHGWLVLPAIASPPHGLVMHVHGGPVGQWRNSWLGRGGVHILMLLKLGYAAFFPNPRGSSGRGLAFAKRVVGDMGGADTQDLLSGVEHLVRSGIADPQRLGVMGRSYGGFMASWLVTQDSRFAAAVPVAPVSNRVSQRLLCTHTQFVDIFLDDTFDNRGGRYFERSPIMYAHRVRTPTLSICGALDRCTPPDQALQFHNALIASGVDSALVRYPLEGHGVRSLPAAIDFTARVVSWFQKHLKGNVTQHA
jgi:dipeptidyl aminopeptidase/acylaminoacyl peptidase